MYKFLDVKVVVDNYGYRVSNGQAGKNVELSKDMFDTFLKNMEIKNGFAFTIIEYEIMNSQMIEMIDMSKSLIKLINIELNKD
jgi:hypothetical protein